jgi:hypothetical protein
MHGMGYVLIINTYLQRALILDPENRYARAKHHRMKAVILFIGTTGVKKYS